MFYFKTIPFPDHVTQSQVETSLRMFALKNTSTLDFKSSIINIGTDKIFFGVDNKSNLQFTRIKTSFEVMLPKLIVKLSKDPLAKDYKIRLGAVPFAVCLVISFLLLSFITSLINGKINLEVMTFMLTSSILFYLLLIFELKLTKSSVLKVIKKSEELIQVKP